MKTLKHFGVLFLMFTAISFTFTACDDDDNDNKNYKLEGNWKLITSVPDVDPLSGKEADEIRLEDSLSNYTFFTPNSEIVFHADSVDLSADFMGNTMALRLPYDLKKDVLTIGTPLGLPFIIQGTVDVESTIMEFELTTESYMSILQFIQPSFLDEILSANVTYNLLRTK